MTRKLEDQNKIVLFYKRNFLNIDLVVSLVFSIIALYFIQTTLTSTGLDQWVLDKKEILYPVITSISGTLLGFIITGVSIILAFSQSEKLKRIRKSKQYKNIYRVYFRAIYYLATTTIISILGIITTSYSTIIFYLIFICSITSLLGLYRCVWVLERIVSIIHKPDIL